MLATTTTLSGRIYTRRNMVRGAFLAVAGIDGVCMYMLYVFDNESWNAASSGIGHALKGVSYPFATNTTRLDGATITSVGGEHQGYCSSEEYAHGRWVRRSNPPSSLEDIRQLYSVTDGGRIECDPPGWPVTAKGQVPLDDPGHIARLLNNTRWRWQHGGDCVRRELSEEAFVVRMLRSKAGIVYVGDSLSEQHHQIVRNFLHSSTGPFLFKSYGDRPRIDQIYLNPNHARTEYYLQAAGVTENRLQNPITTFILERHLLSLAEFDHAFAHLEGYVPLSSEDGPHWWISESIWDATSRDLLAKPVIFREGVNTIEEEPTILVLSTGPHYVASEICINGVSDEDLLRGYDKMVDKVLQNLTAEPWNNVKIWYRASSPSHIDCKDILEPLVENPSWRTSPEATAYNWHLMEPFNDAWRTRIRQAVQDDALGISYLDVWPMSLQRGDSHLLPPTDCMHFCYQGVVEEWQQFLWQEIVRESLNEDYDVGEPIYI